jgi:molybdopterin converting factor small subunit
MRAYLPAATSGNRAEVDVPGGSSVGDLVDTLGAPRRLVFALLLDGRQATLEDALHEGAEVTLMPPFAGGRRAVWERRGVSAD